MLQNILKKCKYHIFIVTKSLISEYSYEPVLSLHEFKNIELRKINNIPKKKKITSIDKEKLENTSTEKILTPFKTSVFSTEGKIIISWDIPKNINYNFVRIFKSVYDKDSLMFKWGKELYIGKGINEPIISDGFRTLFNKQKYREKKSRHNTSRATDKLLSPPRIRTNKKMIRPSPPEGVEVIAFGPQVVNYCKEKLMPYYEDTNVVSGATYKYQVVLYDEKENFSFPIESIVKYETANCMHKLFTFDDYKDNDSLMRLRNNVIDDKDE